MSTILLVSKVGSARAFAKFSAESLRISKGKCKRSAHFALKTSGLSAQAE
jgi:hypothetical protein